MYKINGVQWLSGRVLDSRLRGRGFVRHCVESLSKNTKSSLLLINQTRKTRRFITERLLRT